MTFRSKRNSRDKDACMENRLPLENRKLRARGGETFPCEDISVRPNAATRVQQKMLDVIKGIARCGSNVPAFRENPDTRGRLEHIFSWFLILFEVW